MFDGSDGRFCRLVKGDKLGSWHSRFPRNDELVCSYEPHLLMANAGNIDWRVCLNLWAVVEYVTKYATKAPGASKKFADVLDDAVENVCKYSPLDGEGGDLLRKTLQKFFARSIGGRDYGLFETMQLGLRLPLVLPLMEHISLNTSGTRAFKSAAEMQNQDVTDSVTWDSKVDNFDNRLELWNKMTRRARGGGSDPISALEIKDVSLYEFYWKYLVGRGRRIIRSVKAVAIMVTPRYSADCASVQSEVHEGYARCAVVAYWRLMTTAERHKLILEHQGLTEYTDGGIEKRIWGGTDFKNPGFDRFLGVQDLVCKFDGIRDRAGKASGWTMALLEMLVDPVLAAWVPGWVVEQYERQNDHFRGSVRYALKEKRARRVATNKALLKHVLRRMVRKAKRVDADGCDAGSDSDGAGSNVASSARMSCSDASGEDDRRGRGELLEDARPDEEDAADVEGADGGWGAMTMAQRLSAAAGNAVAAVDASLASVCAAQGPMRDDEMVNPPGYTWSSVVDAQEYRRMKALWQEIRGGAVDTKDGDKVGREELDDWQAFAHDIALAKAAERERLLSTAPGRGQRLDGFKPLRLLLSGAAGTGKSKCVRAIVTSLRQAIMDAGHSREIANKSAVLGAPTGCAAFQMKHGATTAHRAFGIGIGSCFALSVETLKKMQIRFQHYRLAVLDEFSMLGRRFLGQILFRTTQILGARPEHFAEDVSFGGLGVILAGHGDQAKTIGDDSVFNPGKYTGKARNKGKDGQTVYPDVPHFVDNARLAMTEFVDVVLLRRVHRTRVAGSSRESDAVLGAMGEAQREQYEKEGRRYMEVAHRLSDLTWTIEDHAWLSDRYVGKLQETAEGRRELEAAKGAMLLMDGQKESSTGDRGCQDYNAKELRRVARELRKPIASIRALHKQPKDQAGLKADQIHADDFHGGLQSSLEVCERSRVLLTVNLWVEAGLMNGAMGTVRGFVWPKGGDPASSDSSLRVPHAIIVEFDDVDLGTDKAGRKRSFFPDDASRANWVPM
jgi:hypothetical protein